MKSDKSCKSVIRWTMGLQDLSLSDIRSASSFRKWNLIVFTLKAQNYNAGSSDYVEDTKTKKRPPFLAVVLLYR